MVYEAAEQAPGTDSFPVQVLPGKLDPWQTGKKSGRRSQMSVQEKNVAAGQEPSRGVRPPQNPRWRPTGASRISSESILPSTPTPKVAQSRTSSSSSSVRRRRAGTLRESSRKHPSAHGTAKRTSALRCERSWRVTELRKGYRFGPTQLCPKRGGGIGFPLHKIRNCGVKLFRKAIARVIGRCTELS